MIKQLLFPFYITYSYHSVCPPIPDYSHLDRIRSLCHMDLSDNDHTDTYSLVRKHPRILKIEKKNIWYLFIFEIDLDLVKWFNWQSTKILRYELEFIPSVQFQSIRPALQPLIHCPSCWSHRSSVSRQAQSFSQDSPKKNDEQTAMDVT